MLNDYRNHLLAAGRREGTVKLRVDHITALLRRHPDLTQVTTEDLERILASKAQSHSPESRKSLRSSYRTFFIWAERTGRIDHNPAYALASISIPKSIPRLAPDDAIQMALITATSESRAMVLLGRLACLRLTEITTLRIEHREGDLLRVTGKGGKQRMVPVNEQLMHVLVERERELGQIGYYFPGRFGGAMHSASVNKIITRVTGWNPHSLRHAGATAAYRATGDLRAVQELLGHASLATTERYLHTGLKEVRAAAAGTAFLQPPRSIHFRPSVEHRHAA